MIPHCEYDLFTVREFGNSAFVLSKLSTNQEVTIPSQKIIEVLYTDARQPPTLNLDGRLQWLTRLETWNFLTDRPENNDGLRIGIPKETSMRDPHVARLSEEFGKRGLKLAWSLRDNLVKGLGAKTHEVFYDDDGFYLRSSGSDNLILTVSALP
jgi:hypothetical protein